MLTPASRHADFPSLAGQASLNTAAECIPPRATLEAVQSSLADKCAGMNGREAHFSRVEDCRRTAARLVGVEPADVAFCSCASEAYGTATGSTGTPCATPCGGGARTSSTEAP